MTEETISSVAEMDAWIDAAAARLRSLGYRDVEAVLPDGRRLRALRRADFRAEWFFTRLHTFVVFDVLESGPATDDQLRCFTKLAMRWAKTWSHNALTFARRRKLIRVMARVSSGLRVRSVRS